MEPGRLHVECLAQRDVGGRMKRILLALAALVLGCPNKKDETQAGGGPPGTQWTPPTSGTRLSREDGMRLIDGSCLGCHTDEIIAQQRLTAVQWNRVITKMVGWGAPLENNDIAPLMNFLAATYGPETPAYSPQAMSFEAANAVLAKLDDGPFANGRIPEGTKYFDARCATCHGRDGRGALGTNLVDRPILFRSADIARVVRAGRGKMPSISIKDQEVADVVAYLRTLKPTAQ